MIRNWAWGEIPRGYVGKSRGSKNLMIVREDLESCLDFNAVSEPPPAGDPPARFHGRAELRPLRLDNGARALVRAYHHGGLLRAATGTLFGTWPPRPFRELTIAVEVRRRNIPTVEVYAACVRRVAGPLYRGWFITRELEGASDLWTALAAGLAESLGARSVMEAAAAAVGGLHRAGVRHGDLNLKNLLIRAEPGGVKAYVIDFDKARLYSGAVPARPAARNIDRLLRSARKLDPKEKYISPLHWSWFMESYRGTGAHGA